jgi:hypothetical protein
MNQKRLAVKGNKQAVCCIELLGCQLQHQVLEDAAADSALQQAVSLGVCTAAFKHATVHMNTIKTDIAQNDRKQGGTCEFLKVKTASSCPGTCFGQEGHARTKAMPCALKFVVRWESPAAKLVTLLSQVD